MKSGCEARCDRAGWAAGAWGQEIIELLPIIYVIFYFDPSWRGTVYAHFVSGS